MNWNCLRVSLNVYKVVSRWRSLVEERRSAMNEQPLMGEARYIWWEVAVAASGFVNYFCNRCRLSIARMSDKTKPNWTTAWRETGEIISSAISLALFQEKKICAKKKKQRTKIKSTIKNADPLFMRITSSLIHWREWKTWIIQ